MKKLLIILMLIPFIGFGQSKIRNTQITSGNQPAGKVLKSDGATNVIWGDDGGAMAIAATTATAIGTAAKTATVSGYTLTTGDMIALTLTSGNSAAAMTLNINSTGAKNIRMNNVNTTTVFSTLAAGSVILLYYDGTYFQMMGSQRTTDTDTDNFDRMYWNNTITAGLDIYDYKMLMQGTDGKFYPLTLETGTGTTKTVLTTELRIGSPILYYNSTTDVALNGTTTNVYSEFPLANMTYTTNVASWTSQLPIYLKGTVLANGNFKLDNTSTTSWITQTLPTTDDGFVYILLGQMYSTTAMRLIQYHPMYQYKDGAIRLYVPTHTHSEYLTNSTDTLFTTIAISDETTALTTGTAKVTFSMPIQCTLTKVRASVTTAPTGSGLIFDVNENGTSVLSTKLSIDATEKTSVTAASQPVISDSSILDYSEITIDIDQIGSTIAGSGAKIIIYYIKN